MGFNDSTNRDRINSLMGMLKEKNAARNNLMNAQAHQLSGNPWSMGGVMNNVQSSYAMDSKIGGSGNFDNLKKVLEMVREKQGGDQTQRKKPGPMIPEPENGWGMLPPPAQGTGPQMPPGDEIRRGLFERVTFPQGSGMTPPVKKKFGQANNWQSY